MLLFIPNIVVAGELDLGLGYIKLSTHHYKGSNETKTFNLYVPFINYQGDYLDADNAVINSKFYKSRFLSFKLSLGADPNFENDLDYTAAFGITQTTYLSTKILGESWSFELSYGIANADRDYHAYYYTVESEFVTNEREAYKAKSGFSSRVTILTIKKQFGDFLLFPFVRYENLEGSVIEDSLLVKQTDNYFYGMGLFYLFI